MAQSGLNTFGISADTSGLSDFLEALGQEAEVALRPAAQAMTQVLYDQVKLNVSSLGSVTGKLADSIYQAYSPEHSQDGARAEYHVSWNHRKAPHGHLVEYGYIQRFRYYQDNHGNVRPIVRPGMEGRKPPGRRASDSAKAAYYVTLDTPRQVPGKAFVRNAASKMGEALLAGEKVLLERIMQKASK